MSTPVGPVESSRPDVSDVGVGEILKSLTADVSKLVNQEIALAKLEIQAEVKKVGKIAGGYAGAGAAGLYVILFLSLTLMFLLASALNSYTLGALITALVWAVIGAIAFVIARANQKTLNPVPEQTVQTLKEDKEWLKTRKS